MKGKIHYDLKLTEGVIAITIMVINLTKQKTKMKLNNRVNTNRKISTVLLVLVFAAAAVTTYLYLKKTRENDPNKLNNISYEPASEQDQARADETKQKNINRDQLEGRTPDGTVKEVKPVITYAGQYGDVIEVGAYVDGIFEDDGKCTAVLSNGEDRIEKTVDAVKNVRAVDCPVMSFTKSEISPAGTWEVSVKYESSQSKGTSTSKTLEVR